MRIAIMQPTFLPWMGYFDILDQVDLFILLDDVQFVKQSWQQRNRIKTPAGLEWLTIPVIFRDRFGQLIKDVEIGKLDFWKKHIRSIEVNYGRASHFDIYFTELLSIFKKGESWNKLADLNIKLIEWLREKIGISTSLIRSSSLAIDAERSSRLVAICQKVGAIEYLSPIGSAGYLLEEIKEFTDRGIEVFFHNYSHPVYKQLFLPFVPYASVLDLLFNEGPNSKESIRSGRGVAYLPEEIREKSTKEVPQ